MRRVTALVLLLGPSVAVGGFGGATRLDDYDMTAAERGQFCTHHEALFGARGDDLDMPEHVRARHVRALLGAAPDALEDEIKLLDTRTFGPQDKSGIEATEDLEQLRRFAVKRCG